MYNIICYFKNATIIFYFSQMRHWIPYSISCELRGQNLRNTSTYGTAIIGCSILSCRCIEAPTEHFGIFNEISCVYFLIKFNYHLIMDSELNMVTESIAQLLKIYLRTPMLNYKKEKIRLTLLKLLALHTVLSEHKKI